ESDQNSIRVRSDERAGPPDYSYGLGRFPGNQDGERRRWTDAKSESSSRLKTEIIFRIPFFICHCCEVTILAMKNDIRKMILGPCSSILDPRPSILNPRSSIFYQCLRSDPKRLRPSPRLKVTVASASSGSMESNRPISPADYSATEIARTSIPIRRHSITSSIPKPAR